MEILHQAQKYTLSGSHKVNAQPLKMDNFFVFLFS